MNRIDVIFLLLAVVSLIAGVVIGIFMAASHDFALMPVHAHINLVGWVSLALFGLVYRAYPGLAKRKLAIVHVALAVPAALLLPAGIALVIFANQPILAFTAALLWLGAAIVFLAQLIGLAMEKSAPADGVPAE